MPPASNSADSGIGISVDEAANAIANLMDSDESTPEQSEAQAQSEDQPIADDIIAADEQSDDAVDDEVEVDAEEAEGEPQAAVPLSDDLVVDIDGHAVTGKELKAHLMRTADYTRKTQAIAEQRAALDSEAQAVRAEREQYAHMLNALQMQLQQEQQQAEPDWDQLYQADPIEWVRQRELHRERKERAQAVAAEQQRVAQMQQAEMMQHMQQIVARERAALTEAIPTWKDEKTARAEKDAIVSYGMAQGFAEQDLKSVTDHRLVTILRKAWMYDRAQASRQQARPVARQGVAPAQPGNAVRQVSSVTRAKQRLAKTGSVKDAAAAIELLLGK